MQNEDGGVFRLAQDLGSLNSLRVGNGVGGLFLVRFDRLGILACYGRLGVLSEMWV